MIISSIILINIIININNIVTFNNNITINFVDIVIIFIVINGVRPNCFCHIIFKGCPIFWA